MSDERIDLEASLGGNFKPIPDRRVRMDEPLPVRLVAVADVRAPGRTGSEADLQRFYVTLWGFEPTLADENELAFRADNFRLILEMQEGLIERDDLRPIGIEIPSLSDAEQKIITAELEYQRQRGVQPGTESLLLQDPAGNWLELTERRDIA